MGEFGTHYEAYLRSHAKFALDRVQARSDVAADHAERLAGAAVARRIAVAEERAAESDREASRSEGETLQGRLAGLKNSEEYKAQGRIEDKRREVAARAAEVARQRDSLDRDRSRLADQTAAVGKLAARVTGSRAEADRIAAALADAAQRAASPTTASARSTPATSSSRPPAPGWPPAATTSARSAASSRRSATPRPNAPTPNRN